MKIGEWFIMRRELKEEAVRWCCFLSWDVRVIAIAITDSRDGPFASRAWGREGEMSQEMTHDTIEEVRDYWKTHPPVLT